MYANRATWSSDRIEQLKRCFEAGLSSSQIAREMGVTRNAVIGKMSRLGLSRPRDLIAKQLQQKHAKPARSRRPRLNIFAQHQILATAFSATATLGEAIPIHSGRGCTLLELGQGKCRWPIDGPGAEDIFFCGNEPAPGLPYCAGHARLAYRPTARPRSIVRA
jgi:GcrA cell cycle regulator